MLIGYGRQGFTLIEIMLATTAMLIVGAAVHRMLQSTYRLTRAHADQLGLQSSVRGAVLAVSNELRELSTAEEGGGARNDLLTIAPGQVTYRAMRGTGVICESSPPGRVRISRSSFTGHRLPQAGRDSAFVLQVQAFETDPVWVPVAITGVATTAACTGTPGPGITLAVSVNDSIAGAGPGTPVRVYEIMQLELYQSGGKSWLGLRSVSAGEAIQPLFGPLSSDNGFRLDYLDRDGLPATNPNGVTSIRVAVQGEGHVGADIAGVDEQKRRFELTTQIALRNALD